jgi:hypothetical protein
MQSKQPQRGLCWRVTRFQYGGVKPTPMYHHHHHHHHHHATINSFSGEGQGLVWELQNSIARCSNEGLEKPQKNKLGQNPLFKP